MTKTKAEDLNRIMDFLTQKDAENADINLLELKEENSHLDVIPDNFLSDIWQGSTPEELLENIFSLDDGGFGLLGSEDLYEAPSSCSDSGLSSDLDIFDNQLSPLLLEDGSSSPPSQTASPASVSPVHVGIQPKEEVMYVNGEDDVIYEDCEIPTSPAHVVEIANDSRTFQVVNPRKRRPSQTLTKTAVVMPKIQKHYIPKQPPVQQQNKPKLIVTPQRSLTLKTPNVQVIHPQIRTATANLKPQEQQRKVIRVAPMTVGGKKRSILLPVSIKDMKDFRAIKIINAKDLRGAANIQLATANLLKKQEARETISYDYETVEQHDDDSQSDVSDEEEDYNHRPVRGGEGKPYPKLVLTAEERKLLVKEGIKLPSTYPLTKQQERELKRIRRKIRNKISAQDSRKRKKEYVDGLEDRVKQCTEENRTLLKRIKFLQSQNQSLMTQLKRLQGAIRGGTSPAPPATCLLVLLLSVALVAVPSLRDRTPSPHQAAVRRALLSANPTMADEMVIDEGEFNMEEVVTLNNEHSYTQPHPPHILPGGYLDLDIDENWPPKTKPDYKFDFGDGPDYLPPIVKENNFENPKHDTKFGLEMFNKDLGNIESLLKVTSNFLSKGGLKIGEFFSSFKPLDVQVGGKNGTNFF